ncbi:hypothetical protein [Nocardioides sp. YIM 152315]|uniref:hypothetical protein n=1 Tax=Nocardioides sp. YIM 152315 TaxID=3031760 RepID=UPI0023DC39D9|nr:hypothetical protein [Nocardioides sp. YIM 152315]MDF1603149.1 hypothetical protein [Nocardioides sp. YIM 152315]
MTDPTPPPDEPMPDQARARIRAELLGAAQAERRSGPRRWAIPVLAAAAVLVVAGAAGWAVRAGNGDGGGDSGAPAGGATSASESPVESAAPSETLGESIEASKVPGTQEDHRVDVKELGCAETVTSTLPGAEQVATFPDVDGHATSVWVQGDRFTVCDVVGGMTTTHRPLPLVPRASRETFRVSSAYLPAHGGGFEVTRLAAGVVPDGAPAYAVSYAFPDGASVDAELTTGSDGRRYWRVLHSHADDGGNETKEPPITATLRLSGTEHVYTLRWGLDTCAQANHGC